MPLFPYVMLFLGLFLISIGIFDWDFVFNTSKGKAYVRNLGRKGARIFIASIGVLAAGLSALFLFV